METITLNAKHFLIICFVGLFIGFGSGFIYASNMIINDNNLVCIQKTGQFMNYTNQEFAKNVRCYDSRSLIITCPALYDNSSAFRISKWNGSLN